MQNLRGRFAWTTCLCLTAALTAAVPAAAQSVSFAPADNVATGTFNPSGIVSANFLDVLQNDSVAVSSSYAKPGQTYYMTVFNTASNGTLGPPALYPSGAGQPNTSANADIAAGDFKSPGSGGAGLVIANPATNTVTVQGNPFGFSPPAYAVGEKPAGVATPDLNGDGADDLVVANEASDNLSVLINNGSGAFGAAMPVALGSAGSGPGEVGIGDFNGDGHADVAVALQSSAAVAVLLGNGEGGLGTPTTVSVGSQPTGVGVGDFNGDEALDLAVPSGGNSEVAIALGNGNGSFKAPQEITSLAAPQSIAVDDFNGDGHPDLALATEATSGGSTGKNLVSVLLGKGDGTFTSFGANKFEVGNGPVSIASGRLRGPAALPDLFTANFGSNNISVLINDTATCMGKPATIVGTSGPDRLTGTKRADVIVGKAGNDKIKAGAGNDIACGGVGRDLLKGGKGNDVLRGGRHADDLRGHAGRDRLHGGAGKDACRGGAGRNRLRRCE